MIEDLTARLAGLARAMAAPLPSPEELAAAKEQDRALAERIHKARPGIPLHHAYAVLETLRTIQRVEEAKAEPEPAPDDLRSRLVAAFRNAAHDCPGDCGQTETECVDAHPIQVDVLHFDQIAVISGPVEQLADVAARVIEGEQP